MHETFGHPGVNQMANMIRQGQIIGLPAGFTIETLRKYFPTCPECSLGNIQRRPHPKTAEPDQYRMGEKFQVDFQGPYFKNKNQTPGQSIGGATLSFTAIDSKFDICAEVNGCGRPCGSTTGGHI